MKNLSARYFFRLNIFVILLIILITSQTAWAHFQVLIPSTDIVTAAGTRTVDLNIVFTHPMEQGPVMNMGLPARFGVMMMGEKKDLKETLVAREVDGRHFRVSSLSSY